MDGINPNRSDDFAAIRGDVLGRYDGVMIYDDWNHNEPMETAQEKARGVSPQPTAKARFFTPPRATTNGAGICGH